MTIKALNKTQLAILIGCYSPKHNKINHYTWKKQWDNSPELLAELNLTREQFKSVKLFDRTQTKTLINHFQIEDHELQEVINY